MRNFIIVLFNVLLISVLQTVFAQQLPRKGWFGARLETVNAENYKTLSLKEPKGIKIVQVVGGTSKALKLLPDDVLISVDKNYYKETADLGKYINSKVEGNSITLLISRKGKEIKIEGKIVGRDRETDKNATIVYESVPYKEGLLSVIINKPKKEGKLPAVLFIPGYTCSSVDNLSENHPYGRIIRAFSDAGYVVLRVEKSGLGDSQNTPECTSTNLNDEIESFTAGLNKLKSLPYVDDENIFLFGHSMGGIIAPALSAKNAVKGVMVYGTTAKSFFEYQLEMNRLQLMLAKPDPMEFEKTCRLQTQIAYEYYIEKKDLKTIASTPERMDALKKDWQYDGQNKIFDRNQEYWRQIIDHPLLEYWRDTTAKVLVLYGGADYQAFSKPDHEQIVYTVNHYHPKHAELLIFPETDHYLAKTNTRENAFNLFNAGKIQELFNAFDFKVTQKSVEWANNQLLINH
ncbi:alpha/beta fold hydrolase [Flavobacterium sp.]|uniref:alpha/beta fold hydrolase n=1 Tax=Flavobacterium sp. TaxID=239 RepID=UPI00286D161D|nr:alpha/beta fold hydrolase [Flavobacterium sp.]